MTSQIDARLSELGIELPEPPVHLGAELPGPHQVVIPAPFYIPLYEPETIQERRMADMLQSAFENNTPVSIRYRESPFFDRKVITRVEMK